VKSFLDQEEVYLSTSPMYPPLVDFFAFLFFFKYFWGQGSLNSSLFVLNLIIFSYALMHS
jgi:hypothetical protein